MSTKLVRSGDALILISSNGEAVQIDHSAASQIIEHYDTFDFHAFYTSSRITPFISPDAECLWEITKDGNLLITNSEFFREHIYTAPVKYLTTAEYAEKHSRQRSIVIRLCSNGRIPGVLKAGREYLIPEDAPYPADARVGKRV